MKPREPVTSKRIACEVCRKTMRLARAVPVHATGEEYEIWECVACGHTLLRAIPTEPLTRSDDDAAARGGLSGDRNSRRMK